MERWGGGGVEPGGGGMQVGGRCGVKGVPGDGWGNGKGVVGGGGGCRRTVKG